MEQGGAHGVFICWLCLPYAGDWIIPRADSAQVVVLHGCRFEGVLNVRIQEEEQIWMSQ